MDGLFTLSTSTGDDSSSHRADTIDSSSIADSVFTLKLEDEMPAGDGGTTSQIGTTEGGNIQVGDSSQFIVPAAQSRSPARPVQSDFDGPLPIIIPDDSGFKRPACRHVRRRKRSINPNSQSGTSYYACDDCETDFDNEQIQPLVILSGISLQSQQNETSSPMLSTTSQPQPQSQPDVSTYQPYQYPVSQDMILDIQPTIEEQLIVGTLEGEQGQLVRAEEAQMFQYVATINLPQQEGPVTSQDSEEPRTEVHEIRVPEASGSKRTFSVDEIAKMVIGSNLTVLNRNQTDEGGKMITSPDITEKPLSEKPLTEKPPVEKPLSEKPPIEKPPTEKPLLEKPPIEKSPPAMPHSAPSGKPPSEKPLAEKPPSEKPPQSKSPPVKPSAVKSLPAKPHSEKLPGEKPPSEKLPGEKPPSEKPPPAKPPSEKSLPEEVREGEALLENSPSKETSLNESNPQAPSSHVPIEVDVEVRNERPIEETTTTKSSQLPPVKHIYPKRNPHINHSQSFLGGPSSNEDVVTKDTENTAAAARKAKKAPRGKQPSTAVKGKGQEKDSDAAGGDEKETQRKRETRRDAAKMAGKVQDVSNQTKGDEASRKAEDAEENISNSRKRVGEEIGKVFDTASHLAIMKTVKEQVDAKKKAAENEKKITGKATASGKGTRTVNPGKTTGLRQQGGKGNSKEGWNNKGKRFRPPRGCWKGINW